MIAISAKYKFADLLLLHALCACAAQVEDEGDDEELEVVEVAGVAQALSPASPCNNPVIACIDGGDGQGGGGSSDGGTSCTCQGTKPRCDKENPPKIAVCRREGGQCMWECW